MLPTSPPGTYYYPSQAPAKYGNFFPSMPLERLETIGGATDETRVNRDYHQRKEELANEMAKAYVYTNKKKDEQKLVNPLPPSGRITFKDGIAVHTGTKQREPDWDIRYANVGAQPLQGGVMNTAQGRMFVKDRLKSRIDELNAIQSGNFTPEEPKEKTSKREVDAASVIYQLLLDINAFLSEGVLDQKVIDLANGVVGRLFTDGNTLSVSDVSRMLDITYRIERDVKAIQRSGYEPVRGLQVPEGPELEPIENAEGELVYPPENAGPVFGEQPKYNRSYLYLLERSLKRILGVLTTLNKNIFLSDEDKKTLLEALRPSLFKREIKSGPIVGEPDILAEQSYESTRQLLPQPGQEAPTGLVIPSRTNIRPTTTRATPSTLLVPKEFRTPRTDVRTGQGYPKAYDDTSFFF